MGKNRTLTAAIILFLAAPGYGAGETAGDILKTPPGARPLAMGGAYTASVMCPDGMDYNPAGIAFMKSRKLSGTHQILYSGMAELYAEHAAYAQRLDRAFIEGAAGLSFNFRWMEEISNEDAQDPPVTYNDFSVAGVYAAPLKIYFSEDFLKDIYAGIAVKFLGQAVGVYQGSSVAADLGAIWAPDGEKGLRAGIALLNAGMPLKLLRPASEIGAPELGSFNLPLTLRTGVANRIEIDKENSIDTALDYIQDFYDYARFAAGFEYNLASLLFMRLGYNTSVDTSNPAYASAGAGISVTQFDITVGVDYTYRLALWRGLDAPVGNHVITVKAAF